MQKSIIFLVVAVSLSSRLGIAQDWTTRPEETNFQETSRYGEVVAFLDNFAVEVPESVRLSAGYSYEGRSIPLVALGTEGSDNPVEWRKSAKLRVLVVGGIHPGEACGKEAILWMLRDIKLGQAGGWADSLLVAFMPLYNVDGNEKVKIDNRPYQHGPVAGMGQRPTAEGYDLNRDNIKTDSPEVRALVRLLRDMDPHVTLDLHTTNGTTHAYHLTYAQPLHPNTSQAISNLLRNEWLPEMTETMHERYGRNIFHYGNLPWRGSTRSEGWYTFDYRPRFLTNYVGLRNRIAILSEAYAYTTFKERIETTYWFVDMVLAYASRNAARIGSLLKEADNAPLKGAELAITARMPTDPPHIRILMGEVKQEANPYSGHPMNRRVDSENPTIMPDFTTFEAAQTSRLPVAYAVLNPGPEVSDRLELHGLSFEVTGRQITANGDSFKVDSTWIADDQYQQHFIRGMMGGYESGIVSLPPGTLVVPTNQPLALLAFQFLEPMSDDGFTTWNLFDDYLEAHPTHPVVRLDRWPMDSGEN